MLEEVVSVHGCAFGPDRFSDPSSFVGQALTRREYQVWSLMTAGWSDAQIAGLLCLNPLTVRFHLTNAIAKLGTAYRHEAAVLT